VNGTKVGETTAWDQRRIYKIPRKLLKAGRNTIAVRVLDTAGGGGLYGQPADLKIVGDKLDLVRLDGEWRYHPSTALKDTSTPPQRLDGNPNVPTVLSNGMIACLEPFAIKGAIWYQGESNAGRADQYRQLLPLMIRDWRKRFEVGDFPFYIVQLANFMDTTKDPVQSGWAELREARLLTTQKIPNCGVAVITDIGDAKDIHPRNKQDVGLRLALQALAKTYDKKITAEGPLFKELSIEGDKARVRFSSIGDGLTVRGETLAGFAIAGEDGKFVHATATIDGDCIIVHADSVKEPRHVRYGWANNPPATLFNKDGLPASPFRSDTPRK
jgi:sialate O-acetylesterase